MHNSDTRDWCDEGFVDDCSGDGDCCPESWIGDGFVDCEDQTWGCDLTCYDNDGGDCGFVCGDGYCDNVQYENVNNCPEDCIESETCDTCEYNYTNYGSECCDSAWYEYGIDCITLEENYSWDCSGCTCPGDEDSFCGDGYCIGDETASNCPVDCDIGPCSDGYLLDCSGDADCCPSSWLGDGYGDCEDQEWGCDLTCYDNDGGDCTNLNCEGYLFEINIISDDSDNINWILYEEIDAYQDWFEELLSGGDDGDSFCIIGNNEFLFEITQNSDGICCNGGNRSYDILINGCSMIDVLDVNIYEYNPNYYNFNPNEYMALVFSNQGTNVPAGNNLSLLNFSDSSDIDQDCLFEFYINPIDGNYMDYEWGEFNDDQLYCNNPVPACIGLNENSLIANFSSEVEGIYFKHDGCITEYTSIELADFYQKEYIYFRWDNEDDDNDCIENDIDNCSEEYNPYQSNYDGDVQGDACDLDDDNDGIIDTYDPQDNNEFICGDSDEDTCDDCSSGTYDPSNDCECSFGDIDCNGQINVIDIVMAVDIILNNNYDSVADLNEDGLLNVLDVVILIDWILNP